MPVGQIFVSFRVFPSENSPKSAKIGVDFNREFCDDTAPGFSRKAKHSRPFAVLSMKQTLQNIIVALVFLQVFPCCRSLFCEEDHTAEVPQDYILLKIGKLMRGTAVKDGVNYNVKTEYGSIQIPAANIEFIAQSLKDVYNFKRNFVSSTDCNELIRFAEWCLNNGLTQEGIEEFERAKLVATNAALTSYILQRLDLIANPVAEPFLSDAGQPYGKESEVNHELREWRNGLPKTIVEPFSGKIQPLLTARCASANCHGTSSQSPFKLRIPQQINGTSTFENLRASIQHIHFDNPKDSPLVTAFVTYHGGVKPSLTVESNQYDTLMQWVQLTGKELPLDLKNQIIARQRQKTVGAVANRAANGVADAPSSDAGAGLPPMILTPPDIAPPTDDPLAGFMSALVTGIPSADNPTPQLFNDPTTMAGAPPVAPPIEMPTTVDYHRLKLVKPNPAMPTKNPFDPTPFNRRFHPEKVKMETKSE